MRVLIHGPDLKIEELLEGQNKSLGTRINCTLQETLVSNLIAIHRKLSSIHGPRVVKEVQLIRQKILSIMDVCSKYRIICPTIIITDFYRNYGFLNQ